MWDASDRFLIRAYKIQLYDIYWVKQSNNVSFQKCLKRPWNKKFLILIMKKEHAYFAGLLTLSDL